MGLGDLVLVAPWQFDPGRAAELAVHARDVVARCRITETLAEAVADCGLVAGTTSRRGSMRRDALTPRAIAAELLAVSDRGQAALVFGPEDHGLSNRELDLCQRLVTIPTHDTYASLNLAQAVLVCAYELCLASAAGIGEPGQAPVGPAPSARLEFMYMQLEAALREVGFLHAGNTTHMMRRLRRTLGRTRLSDDDVQMFLGIARQMRWAAAERGTGTRG